MTWREKMCARLLLCVAKMLSESLPVRVEIQNIANAIHCAPAPDTPGEPS